MKLKRNNKGITVIFLALSIVALCALVGLGVDIGYMYLAKGQLQNAADAAALAGAAKLVPNNKDASLDGAARTEAVTFAGNNKAAGVSLTLDTNSTNDANGDVVLGNWDPTRSQTPTDLRFLPADGTLFVNAVKVVARRTGESGTGIGANTRVSIFFGKVLSLVGGPGWPTMTASAQAIALNPQPTLAAMLLCFPTCGQVTSLTGTKFYFNIAKGTPNTTWTSFLTKTTNTGDVNDYLSGKTPPPDLCSLLKSGPVCLFTTQGTVNPDMCLLISQIRQHSQTYTVNGQTITGWKVFIPILDGSVNTCGGHGPCLGDPGNQPGDAYNFVKMAVVYLMDAVAQGNCPKLNPNNQQGDQALILAGDGPGAPGTSTIVCHTCDELAGELSNAVKLVK